MAGSARITTITQTVLLLVLLGLCLSTTGVHAFGAGEIPAYSALSKTGALASALVCPLLPVLTLRTRAVHV